MMVDKVVVFAKDKWVETMWFLKKQSVFVHLIFGLGTISEKYLEKRKELFIAVVDVEEAFDRVN